MNIKLFHSCLALKLFLLFVFILSVLKGANGANVFRNIALDTLLVVLKDFPFLCFFTVTLHIFFAELYTFDGTDRKCTVQSISFNDRTYLSFKKVSSSEISHLTLLRNMSG